MQLPLKDANSTKGTMLSSMHQYIKVKSSSCDLDVYLTPETDAAKGEQALSPLIKI